MGIISHREGVGGSARYSAGSSRTAGVEAGSACIRRTSSKPGTLAKSCSMASRISWRRRPAAGCMIGKMWRPPTGRRRPRTRLMLCPGRNLDMEKRPRVTISKGSINSICRSRYLLHAEISLGTGSRLLGGRHLTMLAMYTWSRDIPIDWSNSSRKFPAGPTKGRPCRSSWNPGPSPMKRISALAGPSPGTALVREPCSGQSVQFLTSSAKSSSVSMVILPTAGAVAGHDATDRQRSPAIRPERLCL